MSDVELSNTWTDATRALHHAVWRAIEDLHAPDCGGCSISGCCDANVDGAAKALFTVIYRHRPEPVPTASVTAPPLYPGWRPVCMNCGGSYYPCSTLCDVAWDLLVPVPEELSDGVKRIH